MKKRNIFLIHFLYWFYIINQLLFPVYVGNYGDMGDTAMMEGAYLKEVVFSLFLNALSFYSIYFAFPAIIGIRKKILIIFTALILVVFLVGIRLSIDYYYWKYFGPVQGDAMAFKWLWVWNELRMVVITAIYAILIRYMILALENQKIKNELITQKQAGELALLKSQVNPHFLFNTLNNIYSLVYHQSKEAPEAVMKFSSIMRYVLYDTKADNVLLDTEIEYLRNYIELQELRFKKTGLVSLDISGDTGGVTIAPMLLIPFVENAFKHGNKDIQPAIIVTLFSEKKQIRFEVTSYIKEEPPMEEASSGGLGLSNIRRRLELLYPGKHRLEINELDNLYQVNLIIDK